MANDKWWGRKDSLWGGETFTYNKEREDETLHIKKGDKFRVEKKGGRRRLTPYPDNPGSWKNFHSAENPIELHRHYDTIYKRAYSMWVRVAANAAPEQFFLVEAEEQNNVVIKITAFANGGGEDGTVSVER